MNVYLVNPSHVSFGIGVITPRWLYVLASATPESFGTPLLIDETLESFDPSVIGAGDVVAVGEGGRPSPSAPPTQSAIRLLSFDLPDRPVRRVLRGREHPPLFHG